MFITGAYNTGKEGNFDQSSYGLIGLKLYPIYVKSLRPCEVDIRFILNQVL